LSDSEQRDIVKSESFGGLFKGKKPPKENEGPQKGRKPVPKRIAPLTETKVRKVKPTEKPQKLFDG